MGRQQYLTRLALGRSAFQNREDGGSYAQPSATAASSDSSSWAESGVSDYIQQYDDKDRPINPATEVRNAEMRRAQNSILALVGVVQERERREQSDELKFRYFREARQATLKDENEVGYNMTVLPVLISLPLEWWAGCLMERCIIGLHHARTSFAEILLDFLGSVQTKGLKGMYEVLFPGSAASLVHHFARFLPGLAIDQLIIGPLQQIALKDASRKSRRKMLFTIGLLRQAILLAVDLAVLPLAYYSVAQQLGLAPAFPLLPPVATLLPWDKSSLHSLGWQGTVCTPLPRNLTAPAALLLIKDVFWSDMEEEEETPVNPTFTSFRTPDVNTALEAVQRPSFIYDPLGWILDQAYRIRAKTLYWAGWTLVRSTDRLGNFEDNCNMLEPATTGPTNRYRSSALAHLPAALLATKFDDFMSIVFALPFTSLMLRAVASTYMASSLPKTPPALVRQSQLYPQLNIGTLNGLQDVDTLTELGSYASKIGLCLALKLSIDATIFDSVYRFVRRHGVRHFNWGSRCYVGGIVYATPSNSIDVSNTQTE